MTLLRRMYAVLPPSGRRQAVILIVLTILMGIVEIVGILSITPFMALVANPEVVQQNPWMRQVYDELGFTSIKSFLLFTGVVVLVALAARNAFSAFTTWYTFSFTYRQGHQLSRLLLARYLARPYSWFVQRNSSDLCRNVLTEVGNAMTGVFLPVSTCMSRSIVAGLIFLGLVLLDPLIALSTTVVLGAAYGAIFFASRRHILTVGHRRAEAAAMRYRMAAEAIAGFKDTKTLGRESLFLERYSRYSKITADLLARHTLLAELPRYFMETMAFGGILCIVLYFLARESDLRNLIPMLSLYALAGYRLMPALQQAFSAFAQIKLYVPVLDDLYEDLVGDEPHMPGDSPRLPLNQAISLEQVTFTYEGALRPALAEVSLTIPKNRSVAFVGSTGAGKTTMADLLLGLLEPQEGSILIDGKPLTRAEVRNWQRNLGYVAQSIYLSDDTITGNIAYGVPEDKIDHRAVEEAARIANLHDFIVGELPAGYGTLVGERGIRLSGGQRQRIGIARALYQNPDVIVLDEATSALDGITEEAVMCAIQNLARRKTLILIAHRLSTVRDCDVIYELERGRVKASGTYEELLHQSPTFRQMARANKLAPPVEQDLALALPTGTSQPVE